MTLVELHVDVARVADALEKLVFLLEKLVFPPLPAEPKVEQATLDDLHSPTEEDYIQMQAEKLAFAEQYQVAPDSPAFSRMILAWEEQQRYIHGEEWQSPKDWRSIMAEAERRTGESRTRTDAAAETADRR
jgi:hypothetical protein